MDYTILTDIKFKPLELIDAGHLADKCSERWWNQALCRVNDCVVRVGVFEGEFHWHKHNREDEFFFVIEGKFLIDFKELTEEQTENQTIELKPRQGFLVPRGVMHRTRAPQRSVVLMIEAATVIPTGD